MFYNELQNTIDQTNDSHKIILLGDFNARVENDELPGVKQRFNEPASNEHGEYLTDLCVRDEMRINNRYFDHKEQH